MVVKTSQSDEKGMWAVALLEAERITRERVFNDFANNLTADSAD